MVKNIFHLLSGHECVFAILLSYVRDLLPPTDEPDVDLSLVEDLASSNVNFKCTFFLKQKRSKKLFCNQRNSGEAVNNNLSKVYDH